MSSPMTAQTLPTSNELAVERTRLAYERTMMAWVRTSVSLISFGFSIYKFFDFAQEPAALTGLISPRRFATIMIGTGLITLGAAAIQHSKDSRALPQAGKRRHSLATVVATFVAVLGVLAMTAVLLHE
jgi:putative membrane protein